MKSKESALLDLIFGRPKQWHFEDLRSSAGIGKPQLARWLTRFQQEGLIKRTKQIGRMPYYEQNTGDARFRNRKRLYGMQKLVQSGLLDHLAALEDAKVVILFGSFSRWDWYSGSDIDIFIYGDDRLLGQGKYEMKLKHEIEIHSAKHRKDLKRMERLLPSILAGDFIKGSVEDLGVDIRAPA